MSSTYIFVNAVQKIPRSHVPYVTLSIYVLVAIAYASDYYEWYTFM